jgi:hypothetical protein
VSDAIVQAVITPLLADYDGQLVKLSTPDGLNHFHDDYMRGMTADQGRYRSFRFPTSDNPHISAEYLANERATKPERIFAQEYEAAFLDRDGAVFRKIMGAVRPHLPAPPVPGREYVMGVDWGRSNDFTVVTVMDIVTHEAVCIDRFNQIDWSMQRGRLIETFNRYRPYIIIAEANSIGQPNIEALQTEGLPVLPFTTTNATKAAIIDLLALSLERQEIGIPDDPILIGELMQYSGTRLPSGLIQYSAPSGKHDDMVISLALARHGAHQSSVTTTANPWG